MKTLILKIVFIALVTLGLNGCYTIIWSPDSEFPTEDNSTTDIYYGNPYYGDYYYFYDTPWWWDYSYTPVVTKQRENTATGSIRDLGRGQEPRVPVVIETAPPSRNADNGDTGTTGNKGNNSSSTETTVRSSSSSNSGSSDRQSSSSGSTVRNNNGGRSSGGRK